MTNTAILIASTTRSSGNQIVPMRKIFQSLMRVSIVSRPMHAYHVTHPQHTAQYHGACNKL